VTIQVQTRRNGSGHTAKWEVDGEWRGRKLPQYALAMVRETRQENIYSVRVVTSDSPDFIR